MKVALMLASILLCGCTAVHSQQVQNEKPPNIGRHVFIKTDSFNCIIGDNSSLNEHRDGYNGIFSLIPSGGHDTVFVPFYAGWNLEHYFDARPRQLTDNVFFEPRRAPMIFRNVDASTIELYQPQTPFWGVESWSIFTVREPYYIDFKFRCIAHKPLEGNFLGCFWASYINAPKDKSMYFLAAGSTLDKPKWAQFCTLAHDRDSSILPEKDEHSIQYQETCTTLYNSISPLRYGVPMFYGRIDGFVLIYLFEPDAHIRLSHSPSGGGETLKKDDTNPAWDFQYLMPNIELEKEYGFRARLVCKKWVDREDVLKEAKTFFAGLKK